MAETLKTRAAMPIRRFSYYISETLANLQTGVSQRLKPSRCLFRRTHKGFLDCYHSLLLCEVWSTWQNILFDPPPVRKTSITSGRRRLTWQSPRPGRQKTKWRYGRMSSLPQQLSRPRHCNESSLHLTYAPSRRREIGVGRRSGPCQSFLSANDNFVAVPHRGISTLAEHQDGNRA